jgi:hypothetical protein
MKFNFKKSLVIIVILFFSGCGVGAKDNSIKVSSSRYVDCSINSANSIRVEDGKVMLVYDQKLDKREGCMNRH